MENKEVSKRELLVDKKRMDEKEEESSHVCLGYVETFKESIDFYTKVLGFVLVERLPALDFNGSWLFNCGVGIHLVQSKDEDRLPSDIDHLNPMDNHISFQV